ncbi:MAG TPA: response regulator [Polyangiaceae bacterium]|nr:response regulator [Polyangiaceae bacterium]
MNDESDRLRATIRTQEAIVRAIADELQRNAPEAERLRDQANAESARLVTAMKDLSRARSHPPTGVQSPPPSDPSEDRTLRRVRVLLVDDDDAARRPIADWLAEKYDVVTACDGVEGLRRAQETLPDAVIADVQMPRMDGITMVQRIRELSAPAFVPVLFLTGHSTPENVMAGFSAGGVGYLVKPVDFELLDEELRWALATGTSSERPE